MRIAQIAPLAESVPPKYYGGTERVVSYLTEELVRQGHDVTLFASGDSRTRARLVAAQPHAARAHEHCADGMPYEVLRLEHVLQCSDEFDIAHFHSDYLHFPVLRRHPLPGVTTAHGRMDIPQLEPLFREFADVPMVSISDAQRLPLPWANWQATVYHGLPENLYSFHAEHCGYLAFLGRISPEKRVEQAVSIARQVGMPLKIAAKVDPVDRDYFTACVEPLLRDPLIEFVGEICDEEKASFLGEAYALLFTIDWPEPFGLVMIESMACGTPIIANRRGSVPEVLRDGCAGYIVDTLEQAVAAVDRVGDIPRESCRRTFEERFSVKRMAEDYVRVYEQVIAGRTAPVAGRA